MALGREFIVASLALNIVVLVPVCYGLYTNGEGMKHVYGAETPARGILKAMYTSILFVSLGLVPAVFIDEVRVGAQFMAAGLLIVQIVYKFLTPATTTGGVPPGFSMNPAVLSNLGIALFHCITLGIFLAHAPA
ncbi:Cacna1g [Symbiodinium microadriaticum]|nr:Cacna1g [Symbiodinium microadriaticum]